MLLSAEHLTKTYGAGESARRVLDDVSFCAEEGEFIALTGPSGSGKSTLLNLIGGLDRPTAGALRFGDTELTAQSDTWLTEFRRRQVGIVYQFYNLIPLLTVRENIELPLRLDGKKVSWEEVSALAERLGIGEKLDAFPAQLSGGQQQRAGIARALITHPALILADEPTGNLDSVRADDILRLLWELHRAYRCTLILVTHDRELAARCDRVLTLRDGRITGDEVLR